MLEAGIEGAGVLLTAAVGPLTAVVVWVCVAVILGKWALEGLVDLLSAFWPFPWPFRRAPLGEN
jgi:hypothetical protein